MHAGFLKHRASLQKRRSEARAGVGWGNIQLMSPRQTLPALADPQPRQASNGCDTLSIGFRHSTPRPIFIEWWYANNTILLSDNDQHPVFSEYDESLEHNSIPPPSHSRATFPPKTHHKPESQEIPGPGHRLHGVLAQLYRQGGFLRPQARTRACGHPVVLEQVGRTGGGVSIRVL